METPEKVRTTVRCENCNHRVIFVTDDSGLALFEETGEIPDYDTEHGNSKNHDVRCPVKGCECDDPIPVWFTHTERKEATQ